MNNAIEELVQERDRKREELKLLNSRIEQMQQADAEYRFQLVRNNWYKITEPHSDTTYYFFFNDANVWVEGNVLRVKEALYKKVILGKAEISWASGLSFDIGWEGLDLSCVRRIRCFEELTELKAELENRVIKFFEGVKNE